MPGGPPGYWMRETGGVLVPAVRSYLRGAGLTDAEVGIIRAYLRQWIASPVWMGPDVPALRALVERIETRQDITDWLDRAALGGIDPL